MEEEISLREILEAIWDGKWIIAIVTGVAILISAIYSFFVIDPSYEARSTVMVNPQKSQDIDSGDAVEIMLASLSQYPQLTMQTYVEQVKNRAVMNQVVANLNLEEQGISIRDLQNNISTEIVNDTNLLRIKVTDTDPSLATEIANEVTTGYVAFTTNQIQKQMMKSAELLEAHVEQEEENLLEVTAELKEFMKQPTSVEELSQEIDSRLSLINTYKTNLEDIEVDLATTKVELNRAERELADTPLVLVTNKSLSEDPHFNAAVAEESEQSYPETGTYQMRTEEVNPTYVALENTVTNNRIELSKLESQKVETQQKIQSNQATLEELQVLYTDKKLDYDLLKGKVDNARKTYDTFVNKFEEARVTGTAQLGEANIMVVTPAFEPEVPVGPRKMLNIAIAGVVGGMLSVFIVFFRHYWRSSASVDRGTGTLSR